MTGCDSLATAPDVLTVPEAARLLRIGKNKVYGLIREGKLRAIQLGRRLLVPKVAVMELLGAGAGA